MKCSNCGNEIDETTEVCSQCGAKIEKQEAKQEAKEVEILKEEKNNKSEKNAKVNVNSTSKKTFNPNEKKNSKAGIITLIAVLIILVIIIFLIIFFIFLAPLGGVFIFANKATQSKHDRNSISTYSEEINNKTDESDTNTTNKSKEKNENEFTNLNFSNMYSNSEFSEGIYVFYNNTYGYIAIDEDGKYLFTLKDAKYENYKKYLYKGGYVEIETTNSQKEKVTKIIDKKGNTVMSTEEAAYDEISYKGSGVAAVKKKDETYNSVSEKYALVDVKTKEYLLGPSEEYKQLMNLKENDNGMYEIKNTNGGTLVFNAKTKQQITYKDYSSDGKFYDNHIFISTYKGTIVADTNGNENLIEGKKMVAETANQGLVYCEENCFCNYSGEIIIDLSNEYHNVQNKPTFSNGYALIIFKNDAGTNYYTIIDSTGKRTIEPQKYGTKNDYITKIESDNLKNGYFMVEDINSKKVIMDYNGKVQLSPESGEKFEKFDGKYVYVTKIESSYTTKQYFRDLKGNKITVTKE